MGNIMCTFRPIPKKQVERTSAHALRDSIPSWIKDQIGQMYSEFVDIHQTEPNAVLINAVNQSWITTLVRGLTNSELQVFCNERLGARAIVLGLIEDESKPTVAAD